MPPDVVCRITQSQPPLRTRASHPHAGCAGLQPAYSDTPPGSAGFQPASSDMPRGCAGVSPACRVRRRRARIQQYTPSPLHRLGARASRPHAGCTGIAPAYSDTPHHPCTAWVRGLPACMPGVQALRPHTAIHLITPAPPGCAGFQPACRVYRHCARIQRYTPSPLHRMGARASSPHAGCAGVAPAYSDTPHHPCTAWVRGRLARMPRAEGHTWQRQWVLDQSLTS